MSDRMISVDEYLNVRKGFTRGDAVMKAFRAPPTWDAEKRSARFVMSSESPDRDNDIVLQAGINLDAFMSNPVALLFHNSREFPVGKWTDVQKVLAGRPKRLEGTLEFLPAGADEDADRAAAHVGFGSLRTVSIGFIPKAIRMREQDPNMGGWPGYEIIECELIECSLVPVPAQPDALVKSIRSGALEFRAGQALVDEILDTYVKTPAGILLRSEFEAVARELAGNKTTVVVPKDDLPCELPDEIEDQIEDDIKGAAGGDEDTTKADDEAGMDEPKKSALAAIRKRFEGLLIKFGMSFDPIEPEQADPAKKASLMARAAEIEARVKATLAD